MVEAIVAVVGLILLLAVGLALSWQARRRVSDRSIVYSVEDSIEFVRAGLGDSSAAILKRSDLRRLLEWSVRYLQEEGKQPATAPPLVAGGLESAEYIQTKLMSLGFAYDAALVVEVLGLQTEYLSALGAIGAEVSDQ